MCNDFSVLMSVYAKDKPEFLRIAIESIYMQSVLPSSIIIVEDGIIPEELSMVIKGFLNKVPKIIPVIQTTNKGLGASLNLGSKYVSTKWIARMDADDICLPNRFEKELKYLKSHPEVDLLGAQISEFADTPDDILEVRRVPINSEKIKKIVKWRNPFNHVTIMIKRSVLIKSGNYQDIIGFEDYDLWNRVIALGYKVHNLDESLVNVRVGDGMYKRRGGINYFKEYIKLKKRAEKLKIINKKEKLISICLMFINIIIPNSLRSFIYRRFLRERP